MTNKTVQLALAIIFCIVSIFTVSCTAPYKVPVPVGFARYTALKEFKTISPEGIIFQVRAVKNKPYANLSFWHEALKKRMTDAGYRLINDTLVTENQEKAVCEFAAPIGQKDYLYHIEIIVKEKEIIIIEATGEVVLYEQQTKAINESIKAIQLGE